MDGPGTSPSIFLVIVKLSGLTDKFEQKLLKMKAIDGVKTHNAALASEMKQECESLTTTIMDLQEELEAYRHQIVELKNLITKRKAEIVENSEFLEVFNTKKANLRGEFERYQARRQGGAWIFMMTFLAISSHLLFNGGLYLIAVITELVFLLNWRSLYVRNVPYAKPIGILAMFFILFLFLR